MEIDENLDVEHSVVSQDRQSEQLRAVALFDDRGGSKRYDHDSLALGGSDGRPWWRRQRVLLQVCLSLVGLLFVLVGLLLQILRKDEHGFRWLYFFAALPYLWWTVSFLVRGIYVRIELAYFQELIYYWTSLRFSTTLLVFTLLILPVYQAIFVWAWCERRDCSSPAYAKASLITWNVCLCVVLFALAHFLKSLAAKLISQHFYKTAHIAKVKQALEQEYFLLSLSKPRPESNGGVLPSLSKRSLSKMSTGLSRMSHKAPSHSQSAPGGPPLAPHRGADGLAGGGGGTPHVTVTTAATTAIGWGRVGSARAGEVELHQQIEALTMEATSPHLRRLSAATTASSFSVGAAALPPDPLEPPRPWFWQAIVQARKSRGQPGRSAGSTLPTTLPPRTATAAVQGDSGLSLASSAHALGQAPGPGAPPGIAEQGSGGSGVTGGSATDYSAVSVSVDVGPPAQQEVRIVTGPPENDDALRSGDTGDAAHAAAATEAEAVAVAVAAAAAAVKAAPPRAGAAASGAAAGAPAEGAAGGDQAPGACPTMAAAAAAGVVGAGGPGLISGGEGGRTKEAIRAANAVAAKTFSALVRKYASLTEEQEAEQLKLASKFGKGLFENCRHDPRARGVTLEDFTPFFPDGETAARAFGFFDKNGDGCISKQEMKECVTAIVAERRDMATSLRDTDSIVSSLEAFLAGLVHLVFIAFYLLVWDINVMSGFSTFSATVLALTFVFGESVKNTFQSAVWLFVNHALDVGDTIMLPPDDTWYKVKKFGLVDTILVRDNGDVIHMPNNRLWSNPLVNLTRSGRRTDYTRVEIDTDCPTQLRGALAEALNRHSMGAGRGDFVGEARVRFTGVTPDGKARLTASWTYTCGATDPRYPVARDAMVTIMKDTLAAHGPGGAVHTQTIREMSHHHKKD